MLLDIGHHACNQDTSSRGNIPLLAPTPERSARGHPSSNSAKQIKAVSSRGRVLGSQAPRRAPDRAPQS